MSTAVGRDEVRALAAGGAQVVDVLPVDEYAQAHLPGAINIPLKLLDAASARVLDRDRPVVVYCFDFL